MACSRTLKLTVFQLACDGIMIYISQVLACVIKKGLVCDRIEVFTNPQHWQQWHYCHLCVPIYFAISFFILMVLY